MCGIAGWVDFSRDLRAERAALARMTDSMSRRGPDDRGLWISPRAALGHRRLAVIDPAGGAQPFVLGDDDELVATYSGEIYNFRELRAELEAAGHVFRTRSDTEVLLRSFRQWGPDCVDRLVGMFAFAIWDSESSVLWLVRDRLGIKPLYYALRSDGIVFASEPKGVLASPGFRPTVTEAALPMLLNNRLTPPGMTPLEGLHELRPGHIASFGRSGLRIRRYWQLPSRRHTDDFPATVRTVRELISQSVTSQLVSDVPLCALLSGGLDSTAVCALAAATEPPGSRFPTYSVDFVGAAKDFRPTALRPELDAPYVRLAARQLEVRHTEIVVEERDHHSWLSRARSARDLPSRGQFDTSMLKLFAGIRERHTVALSGEGADEVFGGYPWYHDPAVIERPTFPWMGDSQQLTDLLRVPVRARIEPERRTTALYEQLIAEVPVLDGESALEARMREATFLGLQSPLAALLDRKDRMSMAVGLEVRVPYLDHRLVEYAWNIPWRLKTHDGREKTVLRAAMADVLPAEILHRPKSGYPASFSDGYRSAIMAEVGRIMSDKDSPVGEVLDNDQVRRFLKSGRVSSVHANMAHQLIPIVEVDSWMRELQVSFVR